MPKDPGKLFQKLATEESDPGPETKKATKKPGKSKEPDNQQVGLYIRKDIYKALKRKVVEDDLEISQAVEDAVSMWLNR